MVDRPGRLRILGVAVLAVLVMGGVVASALVTRAKGQGEEASDADATEVARVRDALHTYGRTAPDRSHEMPTGCEPDPKTPAVARFDLPDDVLDFGAMRQGVQVSRDVTLRNIGPGTLCVDDPVTGCGCVQATLVGDRKIPPAGTVTIRVSVDTTWREGKQDKDVRLRTNDPNRIDAHFAVRADVKQGILVVSQSTGMFFGRHAPGKPGEISVRLRAPRSDPPFTVTGVEGQRTAFTFEAKEVEPNDAEFRHVDVTIRHPGALEPTLHNEDVKIKTTNADRPEIVVRTQLLVVDKYYAGPKSVSFGYVGPTTPARPRSVQIAAGEPSNDFRVTGARMEGKGFQVGEPRRVTEGWLVDVTYDGASRKAGTIEAILVVTIDDPEVPELRIPIRATVVD